MRQISIGALHSTLNPTLTDHHRSKQSMMVNTATINIAVAGCGAEEITRSPMKCVIIHTNPRTIRMYGAIETE